jgi:hypothetical protein
LRFVFLITFKSSLVIGISFVCLSTLSKRITAVLTPDPVVLYNFLKTKFQNIFSEPRFTISGNAQFLLPSSDIF